MSIQDKVTEIKKLINLICETIPILVSIIKEIILVVKELKVSQKGEKMQGHNLPYRKSQKIFTREAVRKKTLNNNVNTMRGGIRLQCVRLR